MDHDCKIMCTVIVLSVSGLILGLGRCAQRVEAYDVHIPRPLHSISRRMEPHVLVYNFPVVIRDLALL